MFNIFQNQEKNMHYLNIYSNLSQSVVPLHSHNSSLVNHPISSNLTLSSINNVINTSSKAILQNGKGNKNSTTSKRTRQTSHKFKNELCRVCGDKASGYHYKAITCEGCKVFFLRCVATNAQFNACHSGGNCEMDLYTRRKCQYCRFQKCLCVGMRPECVVLDRQRSRQTAAAAAAAAVAQPGNGADAPSSSSPTPSPSTPSPSHPSVPPHSSPSTASATPVSPPTGGTSLNPAPATPSGKISAAAIIAASRAATAPTTPQGCFQDGGAKGEVVEGGGGPRAKLTSGRHAGTRLNGTSGGSLVPSANDHINNNNGYHQPPYGPPPRGFEHKLVPACPANGSHGGRGHVSSGPTQARAAGPPAEPMDDSCSGAAPDDDALYVSCLNFTGTLGRRNAPPISHHVTHSWPPWDEAAILNETKGGTAAAAGLLQGEQRKLIERLVFYQDQFELPSEEVVRGIEEFFENDKKTNHNEKMFLMMAQFSMLNIQLIIEFSKRLPGFQTLVRQDQITILKACMYEIMLIKTARRYDINTDTIVCCNNKPYTRENFKIAGIVEVCDSMFDFCRGMALLKVDNAEYALLTSICLFEERPSLLEPKKVEIIQEYYLDTLRSYIDCHRPTGSNMLARLLVKLRDLRELNNNHSSMLYSLKVQNFQIPPLMAELWDLPDNFQN